MKYRNGRLAEEIRKIVSEMLIHELKDPRIGGMVSVSAVDVTRDLSYATIYLSVLGANITDEASPERKEEVLAAFESAKGLIRHTISQEIQLRRAPELIFKIDETMEYARHMDAVLDSLK
ncbi:MAG: 30S ribosome-binding factor RbfA [Firmicutes bacterium]|nr:30S ribosome-binding factor RbfA [Bacillota bacterium]